MHHSRDGTTLTLRRETVTPKQARGQARAHTSLAQVILIKIEKLPPDDYKMSYLRLAPRSIHDLNMNERIF